MTPAVPPRTTHLHATGECLVCSEVACVGEKVCAHGECKWKKRTLLNEFVLLKGRRADAAVCENAAGVCPPSRKGEMLQKRTYRSSPRASIGCSGNCEENQIGKVSDTYGDG